MIPRRVQLQNQHLWLLERLTDYHSAREEYALTIDLCRRALAVDECQEAIWRRLMTSLWRSGETTAALRAYVACQEVLTRELDVPPEPETIALAEEIRRAAARPAWRSHPASFPTHHLP
ncbi:bacterial transcriptional activator domain-containing protein, partial [Arthrospira platensis SPKY2]